MNYAIVAFAVVLIISTLTWIFDGRKNYKGPQIEIVGERVLGGGDFDVGRDFDVDDQHKYGKHGGAGELGGVQPAGELPNGHGKHEMNAAGEVVEKAV